MKNNALIFDSNILYVNYDKGGNFNSFYFNSTFQNVIDYIQQKDIYENMIIYIPVVVWEEMKKQKIDAYEKKKDELLSKLNKINIPDIVLIKEQKIDYETYISEQIDNYKNELQKKLIVIKELELPSKERFQSIVKRAFEKNPPFEGKESNSDKGFKDALLWESILELKANNKNYDIILYCNDNMFNDFYVVEDISNIVIKNIVYNEEGDYCDVKININLLLNIPNGTIDTIVEKETTLELTLSIRNGKIGNMAVDYNNHYFEEE